MLHKCQGWEGHAFVVNRGWGLRQATRNNEIMNTSLIIRVSLAIVLGFLGPVAFIAGGSLFEVQGQNSIRETVAGYVALTLFFAVCQFLLARKGYGGFPADWPIWVGMISALLAARAQGLCHNWPQFVAAASGAVIGAVIGAVLKPKPLHKT